MIPAGEHCRCPKCCDCGEPRGTPGPCAAATLTPAKFAELIAEGQANREAFDRHSADMRVLSAEDRARVSR